jgi:hypothetical protein
VFVRLCVLQHGNLHGKFTTQQMQKSSGRSGSAPHPFGRVEFNRIPIPPKNPRR